MCKNDDIHSLILRYFQHEINEEEIKQLMIWLEEDKGHKTLFFQLKSIYDSQRLHSHASYPDPEKSWQKLLSKIQQQKEYRIRRVLRTYTRYAAILILSVATGIGISRVSKEDIPVVVSYNIIQVGKGETPKTVWLPDSSRVIVNAASTFRYPTVFKDSCREVYLDGEAYFEISPNKAQPFFVKSGQQVIEVYGTTFNVQARKRDHYSVTTLVEGSIALKIFDNQQKMLHNIRLRPNEEVYYNNHTNTIKLKETDPSFSTCWTRHEYKFRKEKLSTIVHHLYYYYGRKIRITDEKLKNIRYTGTFSLHQDIEEILRIINSENKFTYTIGSEEIILSPNKHVKF